MDITFLLLPKRDIVKKYWQIGLPRNSELCLLSVLLEVFWGGAILEIFSVWWNTVSEVDIDA